MANAVPSWFAADQVFRGDDGWYIGSPDGFRVGPYPRRDTAGRRSEAITATLRRCRSTSDTVRTVRRFLHEQSTAEGRRLRSGQTAPAPTGSVAAPPVRAGEPQRTWFRTSRFFSVGEVWFFTTREGIDVGPYESKAAAQRDAARLLDILKATATEAEARLAIHQFNSRPVAS